jgi:hypothetical protein
MKYFTAELLERFGSEDDSRALAAETELEQRAEQYARHLQGIEAKLPDRFRELLRRFYLHDARVVSPPWLPDMPWLLPSASRCWPLFSLALQLNTPPKEILVLQYRHVTLETPCHWPSLQEDMCPHLEWQHDEVELIESTQDFEVGHSILFTNGLELRLRFRDFDFATLKPLDGASGEQIADRQEAIS